MSLFKFHHKKKKKEKKRKTGCVQVYSKLCARMIPILEALCVSVFWHWPYLGLSIVFHWLISCGCWQSCRLADQIDNFAVCIDVRVTKCVFVPRTFYCIWILNEREREKIIHSKKKFEILWKERTDLLNWRIVKNVNSLHYLRKMVLCLVDDQGALSDSCPFLRADLHCDLQPSGSLQGQIL